MDAAKKCEDFHLRQGMEHHRTTHRGERIKHCIQDGASGEQDGYLLFSVESEKGGFLELASPEEGP